jgi:hypothetical protein
MKVEELLANTTALLCERGQQYDSPSGERSMGRTIAAFNAITGRELTEAEGMLLLAILKMVRDRQRKVPHQDSCEDLIAYAALYAEARLSERT